MTDYRYSELEKDLGKLAADRVDQALLSVLQLCDGIDQQFTVVATAHTAIAGRMAAIYAALMNEPMPDPTRLCIALLEAQVDARDAPPVRSQEDGE